MVTTEYKPRKEKQARISQNIMTSYRITKFDPKKRSEKGHYLDRAEWTAISDIGKPEYNNITYSDYEKVETTYIRAIQLILEEKQINGLEAESVEQHSTSQDFRFFLNTGRLENIDVDFDKEIKTITNGSLFGKQKIEKIVRLILRETIWIALFSKQFEVRFGYDYYMYVKSQELSSETIHEIERMGLFVEPNID